jgi:sulfate adenylyltransferase subunit 1 (EFTu-like GTPase family)
MELLRFATGGSVDDGKSTLIGRLLYDSKQVFQDQLEAVQRTSVARGDRCPLASTAVRGTMPLRRSSELKRSTDP